MQLRTLELLLNGLQNAVAFGEAVKNSFDALTAHPSPGIAAWRFPPHSLATNTILTLLTTFTRQGFCIEGFGYGSGWAALAGIVTHQHIHPISILISLGGLALHPPTFRTLVAYHSGRYLAYLKDHGAYVDETKTALLDTHPALTFHGSVTPFASYNTSMTVLPLGAFPNFYSHTFTQMVSQFSHCMMACRHNFNSRPIVANFLIFNLSLILDDIDINMSILFPLSNSFPPPPSSLTSSYLFPGRSSRPVRVLWVLVITLTCLTYFSPSSPLWMLYLLLTFQPLRKHSPPYSYKAVTVLPARSLACFTRKLNLMKLHTNIISASLSFPCDSLLLLPSVSLLQTSLPLRRLFDIFCCGAPSHKHWIFF